MDWLNVKKMMLPVLFWGGILGFYALTVGQTHSHIPAKSKAWGIISGRVTDESGNGIKDIVVDIYNLNYSNIAYTYTDHRGKYSVDGLPGGTYKIYFGGSFQGNYLGEWYYDDVSFESGTTVTVTAGQITSHIDAQLAPGGSVNGRLTDMFGKGIDGIAVDIYDLSESYIGSTSTHNDGNYSFAGLPGGSYKFSFGGSLRLNYCSEWYKDKMSFDSADPVPVTAGQTSPHIDAQLAPGGMLNGRVTSEDGKSLRHVRVNIYDLNYSPIAYTHTDEAGNYSLGGLPGGNYKVSFGSVEPGNFLGEWYNGKISFESADPVTITGGYTTPHIDGHLAPGGSIRGRVIDTLDIGIHGIAVVIYDLNYSEVTFTATGDGGYYSVSGLPGGNYKIYFGDGLHRNVLGEWYNDKMSFDLADPVTVTVDQATTDINVQLAPGGIIRGRVTGESGKGIKDIVVDIYDLNYSYIASTATRHEGNYSLRGLADGYYKIFFRCNDQNYFPGWYNGKSSFDNAAAVAVMEGKTAFNIDARLSPSGIISGRITDAATGSGIQGLDVQAYDVNGNAVTGSYSDENGYYVIKNLPTGNFKINFDTFFYNQNAPIKYITRWYNDKDSFLTSDVAMVKEGQPTPGINAALSTGGGILDGRVSNETGKGIANVTVYVLKDWDDINYWDGHTDNNGNYRIDGIPAGVYHVYFLSSQTPVSYTAQIYNGKALIDSPAIEGDWVRVTEDGKTHIDAVLSPAGTVTGRATDENGNGIQNIRVSLYSSNGDSFRFADAVTGSDGTYSIHLAPTGQLTAYFSGADPAGAMYKSTFYDNKQTLDDATLFTVKAGAATTGIDAVLKTGGGSISGYVRRDNGQAINGACIKLYDMAGHHSLLSRVTANSSGYFQFKGIIPGMYKLNASCKNIYATKWHNGRNSHAGADVITVTEDVDTRVDIRLCNEIK